MPRASRGGRREVSANHEHRSVGVAGVKVVAGAARLAAVTELGVVSIGTGKILKGVASLKLKGLKTRLSGEIIDGVGELLISHAQAAAAPVPSGESVLNQQTIIAQNCYLTRDRAPGCARTDPK